MEHTTGMVVLYLWFWLVYRVYSLKEDYRDMRKYMKGEDVRMANLREEKIENIRNSALQILSEGTTKVLVALATVIGIVYYSLDIIGLMIAIMHFHFPTYIYWGILALIGVLVVRLINSSFQIPTAFLLIVHSDASAEAIKRLLKRKFPVRLAPPVIVIIHLICLAVAIYAVAQFM